MPILFFLVSFVPFLFLFTMACEVYFRSKKSKPHQLTAILLVCLSFMFFSDYNIMVLPLENAEQFSLLFKYINAFVVMVFSILFFREISKVQLSGWWNVLFYLPLTGITLLLFLPNTFFVNILETAAGRTESPSVPLLILLSIFSVLTFFWNIFFLIKGYAYAKKEGNDLIASRILVIVKGSLLTIIGICFTVISIGIGSKYNIFLSFLSPYSVLILAFTLRYTMIKFDFLATSEHRYKLLYNMSFNGIVLVNPIGIIIDVNPGFCKILGRDKEEVVGSSFFDLIVGTDKDSFKKVFLRNIVLKLPINEEIIVKGSQNEELTIELKTDYMDIEDEVHAYIMVRDITSQKKYEKKLKFLAFHDPLTGLGNRAFFYERFKELTIRAKEEKCVIGVVLVDLDKFKYINDTYGHHAGDQVLQYVAEQITSSIPSGAYAARMGGDEFAILIPTSQESSIASTIEELLGKADFT